MKNYSYNRASREGRRLFKLLDVRFNKANLDGTVGASQTFDTTKVQAVTQGRANKMSFLIPSNLAGLQRPQVRVEADVELAWGDFGGGVTTLDFTHGEQELPLTYVQSLDDDTIKLLIDAGLYRDDRFEELMTKLSKDEVFDVELNMNVTHLDAGANPEQGESVPVLLVDPVNEVHDEYNPSEHTTITSLVKRSATLAIELRKEGLETDDLINDTPTKDNEVYIDQSFQDVVSQKEEEAIMQDVADTFTTTSPLLDQEIDVTEKLKGGLSFDNTTEDDRIRDLKDRTHAENVMANTEVAATVRPTGEMSQESAKTTFVQQIELGDDEPSFLDISDGYPEDDGPVL